MDRTGWMFLWVPVAMVLFLVGGECFTNEGVFGYATVLAER